MKSVNGIVARAISKGLLPALNGLVACVDCGVVATEYDHRDYNRPLDVQPVCHQCNIRRGPAKQLKRTRTFMREEREKVRNKTIRKLRSDGLSLQAIGKHVGLSSQRIQQIMKMLRLKPARYMAKKKKPKRDQKARLQSIGRQGGLLGGPARAAALTPERRREIALKAAAARWGTK